MFITAGIVILCNIFDGWVQHTVSRNLPLKLFCQQFIVCFTQSHEADVSVLCTGL